MDSFKVMFRAKSIPSETLFENDPDRPLYYCYVGSSGQLMVDKWNGTGWRAYRMYAAHEWRQVKHYE